MKRIVCLFLIFSLLLSGCSFLGERIKAPVTFYYLCNNFQEELCCVVVSEQREASGHIGDLSYLLALYSMGPISDGIKSPLRPGTKITSSQEGNHVILELFVSGFPMSDIDYSLACACLTLTCLEISSASEITIRCGDREKTFDRSSLTLLDTIAETTPTEETQ